MDSFIETKLEKNIIKGRFDNKEHYLRVHYNLMLEDFNISLRNTIQSIKRQVRAETQKEASSSETVHSMVKKVLRERPYFSQSSTESTTINSLNDIGLCPSTLGIAKEDNISDKIHSKDSRVSIHCDVTFRYEELYNEMYCYRVELRNNKMTNAEDFKKNCALYFTEDLENFISGSILKVISVKRGSSYKHQLTVGFVSKPDLKYNTKYIMFEPRALNDLCLKTAEAIQNTTVLPMEKYLVNCDVSTRPPAYLSKDMSYIVDNKRIRVLDPWPQGLTTELNESQENALKRTLTQEFAVIDGPPGTRKSDVATKILETLLTNQDVHKQVPILVLSQTNSAVNHLLERVLKLNITEKGILRVGKPVSHVLAPHNLNTARQQCSDWSSQIKHEKSAQFDLYANLLVAYDAFDGIVSFHTFAKCLPEYYVNDFWHYYEQFEDDDMIDWLMEEADDMDDSPDLNIKEAVDKIIIQTDHFYHFKQDQYKPLITLTKLKFLFEQLESRLLDQPDCLDIQQNYRTIGRDILYLHKRLEEGKALMMDESFQYSNYYPSDDESGCAYALHPDMRWKLYFSWIKLATEAIQLDIENRSWFYKLKHLTRLQQRRDIDVKIFKEKLLIGMTTSQAIIHKTILEEVKPSIVLILEASDIPESHVIAALTPHCQHLILIGNHNRQRKPKTVSLFERMINNNMQVNRLDLGLDVQQRMHQHPQNQAQNLEIAIPVVPDDVDKILKIHPYSTYFSQIIYALIFFYICYGFYLILSFFLNK